MRYSSRIQNSWPSLSLWSLTSSFAQKQNESTQEEKRSYLWNSNFYVKMAVYSICVTSSSLFRFPEAVYKYGGAFIAVYAALMIVLVQPFVYLELLIGQLYSRKLPVRSLQTIFKICATCSSVLLLVFIPHHAVINSLSSAFIHFRPSENFEWCSCNFLDDDNQSLDYLSKANETTCLDQNDYSAIQEFQIFNQHSIFELGGSKSGDKYSTDFYFLIRILSPDKYSEHWFLTCTLSTVLIVIFMYEWKFQNVMSKILLWLTIILPLSLVGLTIFQLNVSGRVLTMMQLFSVDWKKLGDVSLWLEAVRLSVLTSCIGMGLHTTISSQIRMSYRKFYQISWFCIFWIIGMGLISTILLFSEMEMFSILNGYFGPHHFFSFFPQSYSVIMLASIFCKSTYWPSLKVFFWMFYLVRIVAMSRVQVLGVETLIRTLGLNDWTSEKKHRKLFRFCLRLAVIIFMQFGMTAPYIFKGSETIFNNFHLYSGTWSLVILLSIQAFHFSSPKFIRMLEEDLYLSYRIPFPKFFSLQLRKFVPFVLTCISTSLLSYELISKLVSFAKDKNLVPVDWPIFYGIALNVLPYLTFLAVWCQSRLWGMTRSNNGFKKNVSIGSRNERTRKPHYPWQKENSKTRISSLVSLHHDIGHQSPRATIRNSRLRRSNVDNLGNLNILSGNKTRTTIDHYDEKLSVRVHNYLDTKLTDPNGRRPFAEDEKNKSVGLTEDKSINLASNCKEEEELPLPPTFLLENLSDNNMSGDGFLFREKLNCEIVTAIDELDQVLDNKKDHDTKPTFSNKPCVPQLLEHKSEDLIPPVQSTSKIFDTGASTTSTSCSFVYSDRHQQ